MMAVQIIFCFLATFSSGGGGGALLVELEGAEGIAPTHDRRRVLGGVLVGRVHLAPAPRRQPGSRYNAPEHRSFH